jgi:hypothetical protein
MLQTAEVQRLRAALSILIPGFGGDASDRKQ